ncbi:hypothetical protein [Candidatus Korobacter versatilis]|nr:hypothetical protein [Candidatus Koribacter versatilis]
MACMEGDTLKHEVLDKIEEYLNAEQAQYTCSNFDDEFSRLRAEAAHTALTDARRRYWQHLKMHHCDTAAILAAQPSTLAGVAV